MSTAPALLSRAELAAVAKVLEGAGEAVAGPISARLITGGRSNLTFLLTDGTRRWVLRTPPRAGRTPSAHDVAREFRVTSSLLRTDVPVARAVALCTDESLIGAPFTLVEFVPGRSIQTRAELDELDDEVVSTLADRLVQTLAALHKVDYHAIGLSEFGRPDAYAQRQLKRWSGQWDIVGADALDPLAREVSRRLAAAMPEQKTSSIVHGDFRIDNTIVDLGTGSPGSQTRIAAVVDWELSTLGDPIADVAMMCAYRDPALDLILGAPGAWSSPRLPDVPTLAAQYEAAGGVALAHWDFHMALAYYKIAVVSAGIDHRVRAAGELGQAQYSPRDAVQSYLELAHRTLTRP
ncbi:phosphotransferase family protein [Quadrisphaera sp. GCM10027208]